LKTFQIKEPKNLWFSVFENFRIKEVFEFLKKKTSGFHERTGGAGQVPIPEYLIF
jgi:hypothetical protein